MAIIQCPECTQEVSDKAPACPKCGNPVAAQTVQATGKKWKSLQLIGSLFIVLGFGSVCAGMESASEADASWVITPTLMLFGGLVMIIWGRMGAWWHHA